MVISIVELISLGVIIMSFCVMNVFIDILIMCVGVMFRVLISVVVLVIMVCVVKFLVFLVVLMF